MSEPSTTELPQAFFLPARTGTGPDAGQRMCLFHAPATGVVAQGSVLYLHPFAEEMGHARRVVAQQARQLAQAGFAVLQIDLLGCGDSSGNFEDALWEDWLQDAQQALDWLQTRSSHQASDTLWLWGLRSGALLASALVQHMATQQQPLPHLLLWQPVASGQQVLQQFMRLHSAARWLQADSQANTASVAQTLARGETVPIAGYPLTGALADGLRLARLTPPDTCMPEASDKHPRRLVWISCTPQVGSHKPLLQRPQQAWRDAGWTVQSTTVSAPSFWQTADWHEAPELLSATTLALCNSPLPLSRSQPQTRAA
jgi:exosortase A-associated hydrolase 2